MYTQLALEDIPNRQNLRQTTPTPVYAIEDKKTVRQGRKADILDKVAGAITVGVNKALDQVGRGSLANAYSNAGLLPRTSKPKLAAPTFPIGGVSDQVVNAAINVAGGVISSLLPTKPLVPIQSPSTNQLAIMNKSKKNNDTTFNNYSRSKKIVQKTVPAAKSNRMSLANKPRMRSGGKGLVVTHTEMVGSLQTSSTGGAYRCDNYTLNPGNSATFPWLNTIASNFDKYRFLNLEVMLLSNQPTSTAGRLGLGVDFDSTDPKPADRMEFFCLTHHSECAAWDSVGLKIPVDNTVRFVNSHTTTDSKLIDIGQLLLMVDQVTATSTYVADIVISYSIELIDPQQAVYSTQTYKGANITSFADLVVAGPNISQAIATTSNTVLELRLPQGYYVVVVGVDDVGAATPALTLASNNAVGSVLYTNNTIKNVQYGLVHSLNEDGKLKITFGTVAIANLEQISIIISKTSATVFNASRLTADLGTY